MFPSLPLAILLTENAIKTALPVRPQEPSATPPTQYIAYYEILIEFVGIRKEISSFHRVNGLLSTPFTP